MTKIPTRKSVLVTQSTLSIPEKNTQIKLLPFYCLFISIIYTLSIETLIDKITFNIQVQT